MNESTHPAVHNVYVVAICVGVYTWVIGMLVCLVGLVYVVERVLKFIVSVIISKHNTYV